MIRLLLLALLLLTAAPAWAQSSSTQRGGGVGCSPAGAAGDVQIKGSTGTCAADTGKFKHDATEHSTSMMRPQCIVATKNSGSSPAPNMRTDGPCIDWTLTASATFTEPSNKTANDIVRYRVCQDGTGGRTLSFGAWSITWEGGAPVMPTTATTGCMSFTSRYNGTAWVEGRWSSNEMASYPVTAGTAGKGIKSDGSNFVSTSTSIAGAGSCGSNNFVTATNADAAPTCAQPAFSSLSGTATTAQVPDVDLRRVCTIVVGADNGSALADADIGPQNDQCFMPYAATVQEIIVKADGGTPNVIVRKTSVANSHTALLSSALATAASGARACSKTTSTTGVDATTTCTNTLQNTSIAAGETIGLASGTAGGVAKRLTVWIYLKVN